MAETECQRFFALSKRVPKDVKRFCGICRQHGVLEETRGHTCGFKDCTCNKCQLVRTRRQIMSQQIRLRRAQDKRFQRTNEPAKADVIPIRLVNDELASMLAATAKSQVSLPTSADELFSDTKNMCYFCQKCKNHEILVWKKQHKRQCPFTDCTCEKCELIETRRRLDQHMKKRKASLKAAESTDMSACQSDASLSPKTFDIPSTPEHPIAFSPVHPTNDTLKIEDAFHQQKPMFATPKLEMFNSQASSPVSLPSLPIFLQNTPFSLASSLPTQTFQTQPTSAPFQILSNEFLNAAIANLNAKQASQFLPQQQPDVFQMIKTVSPPISFTQQNYQMAQDMTSVSPQQFANTTPPMSFVQQPAFVDLNMCGFKSFKELEQLLMMQHQMH